MSNLSAHVIRTRKQFEEQLDEIRELLHDEVRPLPRDSREDRIRRAKYDPLYFMQTYLPHYFTHDPADDHPALIKDCDTRGKHIAVEVYPRDWAKTTITSLGYPIHQAVFDLRKFFLHVGLVEDSAGDNLEFIKLEFEDNERIQADFGDRRRIGHWEREDFVWGHMRFKAFGLRQGGKRGRRQRQYRPDYITATDLDDEDRVNNEKLITRDMERMISGLYFGLDNNGTMIIEGNRWDKRGIIARIIEEYPHIQHRIVRALETDEHGNEYSTWETRHPTKTLQAERSEVGTIIFNRERQNDPVDQGNLFKPEHFRAAKLEDIQPGIAVQYLDPAIGESNTADYRAHIVLCQDLKSGDAILLEAVLNREGLSGMVDTAYALHERWNTVVAGMEDVLYQKLLWRDFRDGAKRHRYTLPNQGIDDKTPKAIRIESLSGPIELGQIRFVGLTWIDGKPHFDNQHLQELYNQLIYYPDYAKKDGPDALNGAYRLLELYARGVGADTYKSIKKRRLTAKRRSR